MPSRIGVWHEGINLGAQLSSRVFGCGIFISIRQSRHDATTERPG